MISDDQNAVKLLIASLKQSRDDPDYPVKAETKRTFYRETRGANSERGSFGDLTSELEKR